VADRDRENLGIGTPVPDAGRTSGGGKPGHEQPVDVERDTSTRNNPTGSEDDPVMPRDDAALKTKI
jgi:hypothetical protein